MDVTQEQIREYVKTYWKRETPVMMAKNLGTYIQRIHIACKALRIYPIENADLRMAFIIENPHLSAQEIATALKCSIHAVRKTIYALKDKSAIVKTETVQKETRDIKRKPFQIKFTALDKNDIIQSYRHASPVRYFNNTEK